MAHICNTSIWELEAGWSEFQDHCGGLNEIGSHWFIYLNSGFLADGMFSKDYEVWLFKKSSVPESGFEV